MKWRSGRRSQHVEDRRAASGGFRLPGTQRRVGRKTGFGGLGLLALLGLLFFGVDPTSYFRSEPQMQQQAPAPWTQQGGASDEMSEFMSVVLADTEDVWHALFQQSGNQYREPTLVLFSGQVASACGFAQSASGPFYCPGDGKVYLDMSFFNELKYRFKAPGDFAQAYVLAHEVGHHVQNLLGILPEVDRQRARYGGNSREGNALSVRLELQADCFAGVWAHHAQRQRHILEKGDIEEGLNAASAIGDDRIQRQAQGYVVPDSFTHGSSEQRTRWFLRGLKTGQPNMCDTFSAEQL
jgi:predicted metalloprotease